MRSLKRRNNECDEMAYAKELKINWKINIVAYWHGVKWSCVCLCLRSYEFLCFRFILFGSRLLASHTSRNEGKRKNMYKEMKEESNKIVCDTGRWNDNFFRSLYIRSLCQIKSCECMCKCVKQKHVRVRVCVFGHMSEWVYWSFVFSFCSVVPFFYVYSRHIRLSNTRINKGTISHTQTPFPSNPANKQCMYNVYVTRCAMCVYTHVCM